MLANDTDVEGDSLTVAKINGLAANVGTRSPWPRARSSPSTPTARSRYDPNGSFEDLDTGESDTDSFTYRASDGTSSRTAATVTITINGVNDAPVAGAITTFNGILNEGQSTSATLAFTDVDRESHTCTFVWGDGTSDSVIPVNGSATDCSKSHTYGDDEPGAADDIYTVLGHRDRRRPERLEVHRHHRQQRRPDGRCTFG